MVTLNICDDHFLHKFFAILALHLCLQHVWHIKDTNISEKKKKTILILLKKIVLSYKPDIFIKKKNLHLV